MTGSVKSVLLCIKGVYTLIMTRLGLQIPAIDENKVELFSFLHKAKSNFYVV